MYLFQNREYLSRSFVGQFMMDYGNDYERPRQIPDTCSINLGKSLMLIPLEMFLVSVNTKR